MRISDWSSDVCSSDLHALGCSPGCSIERPSARAKLSVNTFELVDASGQAGRGDALGCCFWRRSCLMFGKHKGDAAPVGDAGGDCESHQYCQHYEGGRLDQGHDETHGRNGEEEIPRMTTGLETVERENLLAHQ